jgi:signal peptidase
MQPFVEAILSTLVVSAIIAMIALTYYMIVAKGWQSPVHLYSGFKKLYKDHSRKTRAKAKLTEYKTISIEGRQPILASTILFCVFLIIIFVLLFKLVFFSVVVSNSMNPTFRAGDLVLMQRISTTPVEGDIIMFQRSEYMLPITHRVFAITDGEIRTKGDAVNAPDPWMLSEEAIVAKAVQLDGDPTVIKDIGNYFILDTSVMRYDPKYGSEYSFIKTIFLTIRLYGYVFCVIALLGYVWLTIKEAGWTLKGGK